jgi:hypothetical protein
MHNTSSSVLISRIYRAYTKVSRQCSNRELALKHLRFDGNSLWFPDEGLPAATTLKETTEHVATTALSTELQTTGAETTLAQTTLVTTIQAETTVPETTMTSRAETTVAETTLSTQTETTVPETTPSTQAETTLVETLLPTKSESNFAETSQAEISTASVERKTTSSTEAGNELSTAPPDAVLFSTATKVPFPSDTTEERSSREESAISSTVLQSSISPEGTKYRPYTVQSSSIQAQSSMPPLVTVTKQYPALVTVTGLTIDPSQHLMTNFTIDTSTLQPVSQTTAIPPSQPRPPQPRPTPIFFPERGMSKIEFPIVLQRYCIIFTQNSASSQRYRKLQVER